MDYIRFGQKTELSKVIAGCMRLKDSGLDQKEILALAEQCLDIGITSFDHAPVYGGYTCEAIFGESVIAAQPQLRKRMKLITKTGIALPGMDNNRTIYYNATKQYIMKEVEQSLNKLHTDYIDLLLIHRPDPLADPGETAEALDTLVKEGKVLEVGVSNYSASGMDALQKYMKADITTNQVEISVKQTAPFFDGTVDEAWRREIPLMAWSPLGGGSIFRGEDEQAIRLMAVAEEIAAAHQVSADVVYYAWLFSHPAEIAAITGTMKPDRIKAAADAVRIKLSYDEWYQILEASRGYSVP